MKNVCKKILVLIIILFNCFEIITGCTVISRPTASNSENTKNRLDLIREKGVLTVASSNDRPFSYIDPKTNEFTGIEGDLMTEIARRLNINKVEARFIPFQNLLSELNTNDNIDIIASGMLVTDERKKQALFTNILYKESEAIIVPKASRINFKEDLKDAVIGAQTGSVFLPLAQKWQNEGLVKEVRAITEQAELLLEVASGELDAAIIDSISASYQLSKSGNLNLKILSPYKAEFPGLVAAAVRKTDASLVDSINAEINKMKEDKTLYAILKKYGLNESNFVSIYDNHISN